MKQKDLDGFIAVINVAIDDTQLKEKDRMLAKVIVAIIGDISIDLNRIADAIEIIAVDHSGG